MSELSPANPYAIPASDLQQPVPAGQVPSLAEALSRGYDFSIGGVLGEAWRLVKGSKGLIFGGFLVFYALLLGVTFAVSLPLDYLGLIDQSNPALSAVSQLLINLAAGAVSYPCMAGIMMLGIRRADGQPVSFDLIFSQFGRTLPLLFTGLLMSILAGIGFLLLIIPGIYLSVAYSLAFPLVAERGLSPWQALETSRKAINQHWFKVAGLCLLTALIGLLSLLPLGLGLIWSLPLYILSLGVLYRLIFGVLPAGN